MTHLVLHTGLQLLPSLEDALHEITVEQHRLARRRAIVGAAITRLRTGARPEVVEAGLRSELEERA